MKTKRNIKMNGFSIKRTLIASALTLIVLALAFTVACGSGGIKNGDFSKLGSDRLPTGWTFSSYTGRAENSSCVVISDSTRGNVVRITNIGEDDAHFIQNVSVKPNTVYRFTVDVKTEGVSGGAGANIGCEDINCYSEPLIGTNDWTTVELIGKTGANQSSLKIGCRLGNFGAVSTGTAYFSNFRMEKLSNFSGTARSLDSGSSSSTQPTEQVDEKEYRARMITAAFTIITFIMVPLAIGIFVWHEYARDKASGKAIIKTPQQLERFFFRTDGSIPKKTDTRLHYTKRDWLFVISLTVIYAALAFTNLGSTKAPESEWKASTGTTATLDFGRTVTIAEIWQFGGITGGSGSTGTTTYTLTGTDGTAVNADQRYGIMFRWNKLQLSNKTITTDKLVLSVTRGETWINELAFFDNEGNLLEVTASDPACAALVDEQSTVPEYPGYMSGMYFDELYHARTAYEHLHNLKVYEISHPPLGKIIISVGVAIFGMNPFGWRVMGALFGVLMVPLMYAFGKRIFKRSELALLATFLLTFDFMHFTQTRIATIDSYAVFFNLCMTYFMYKFISMDLGDSLGDTLKPLFLSGLFFGIGCASKWICIYTGAALALMFFAKMIVQFIEAKKLARLELSEEQRNEPAIKNAKNYNSRLLKTILACIPFFIIIPLMIYFAAYFPYYTAEWKPNAETTKIAQMRALGELGQNEEPPANVLTLGEKASAYVKGVIGNQKYMLSYHSKLATRHAYESAWYEWPLSNRPMWFYAGYNHPDKTLYGTISSFGNPAVWWVGFAGTIFMLILVLRGRFKLNKDVFFMLCCMASSMLPWMLISRSVFIYHYFATVPMIILASVYVLKYYEDRYYYVPKEMGLELPSGAKIIPAIKYVWMGIALLLFILFYPVLSGIPVKKTYIQALQWMPTWTFMGTWPSVWPN